MSSAPELKRRDAGDKNVEQQNGWLDDAWTKTKERQDRDIAGCASVTDRGIKKGNDEDRPANQR